MTESKKTLLEFLENRYNQRCNVVSDWQEQTNNKYNICKLKYNDMKKELDDEKKEDKKEEMRAELDAYEQKYMGEYMEELEEIKEYKKINAKIGKLLGCSNIKQYLSELDNSLENCEEQELEVRIFEKLKAKFG